MVCSAQRHHGPDKKKVLCTGSQQEQVGGAILKSSVMEEEEKTCVMSVATYSQDEPERTPVPLEVGGVIALCAAKNK